MLFYLSAYSAALMVLITCSKLIDPLVFALLAFFLFLLSRVYFKNLKYVLRINLWLICFCLSSVWLSGLSYYKLAKRLPMDFEGQQFYIEGKVLGMPKQYKNRVRFDFLVNEIQNSESQTIIFLNPVPRYFANPFTDWIVKDLLLPSPNRKLRLNWYLGNGDTLQHQHKHQNKAAVPLAGETWRLKVKLKAPRGNVNPAGFDYETWLFARDFSAKGYIRKEGDNRKLTTAESNVAHVRLILKQKIIQALESHSNKSIIVALVVGDRTLIDRRQEFLIKQGGIAHLLAISGMHIGLIFIVSFNFILLLFKCLNWLSSYINEQVGQVIFLLIKEPRHISLVLAYSISFVYAVLSGLQLPAQRALLMLGIVVLALIFKKPVWGLNSFLFAIFVVLVLDPFSIFNPSFYLSFVAVFFIYWVLAQRLIKLNYLKGFALVQITLFFALLPILVYAFGGVPLLRLVLNFIAIPMVSFAILPFAVLGSVLLFPFPSLGNLLLAFSVYCLDFLMNSISAILVRLPWLEILEIGGNWLPCFFSVLLVAVLFSRIPLVIRATILILLVPVISLSSRSINLGGDKLVFNSFGGKHDSRGYSLTVFDVGQGLAVLLESKSYTLLYDTGPKYGESQDAVSSIIKPYLMKKGISHIETLVLSHGDLDHRGGFKSLRASFTIGEIYLPKNSSKMSVEEISRGINTPIKYCDSSDGWKKSELKFKFLHPASNASLPLKRLKENNISCVLKISDEFLSVLLPGDIEESVELELVKIKSESLKSDVLLAAHHGSNSSSTSAFIQAVSPQLVIFSAGHLNAFGHPHPKVLNRLRDQNIPSLSTASSGAISLLSHRFSNIQRGEWLKEERKGTSRFWHY